MKGGGVASGGKRGRPRKERYARLMGGFWKNEKIRRLSLEARGLLVTAWSYAASEATNGKIPTELLEAWVSQSMRGKPLAAKVKAYENIMAELTTGEDRDGARPLLTIEDGAIDALAHDWTEINITMEEWEAKLAADRSRKRRDFPSGNTGGNPGGNSADFPTGKTREYPTGKSADFQRVALDEDEDEDDLTDRRGAEAATGGSLKLAAEDPATAALRLVHDREAASERASIKARRDAARTAEGAYTRAIEAAGGEFQAAAKYRDDFVAVALTAKRVAARDGAPVRDVLERWARRYVAERKSRSPEWWLEKVTVWAAEGTAPEIEPADDGRRVPTWNEHLEAANAKAEAEAAALVAKLGRSLTAEEGAEILDRVHAEAKASYEALCKELAS